jgi:6-phosphogluconolactonase (cycloisomerase 2 family)
MNAAKYFHEEYMYIIYSFDAYHGATQSPSRWSIKRELSVRLLFLYLAACASAWSLPVCAQQSFLAVLADTDMVPTVYETGELGPADPRHRDTLATIALPLAAGARPTMIDVSNSVYGPPGGLALSRDARFAFVAEILQPRPAGTTKLSEMVAGNVIRSVDLRRERGPAIIDTVDVGTQPQAIALNPSGDLVVAMTTDIDRELSFVPVRDGRFGQVKRVGLGLPPSSGLIPLRSTWVEWHPRGRYIAVNLVDRAQVAFYEILRGADGSVAEVRPWGNRVQVNKFPFIGRFSPDGRFYVTSDLQWGIDTKGFYGVREGILTTVRTAEVGTNGDAAHHTVPHIALGGWGSETMAFSPDGRFLVTSNLRGTGKPAGDPDRTEQASISLYEQDPASGRLVHRGEWTFDAVLPQGLAFDRSGEMLYVGVNRYPGEAGTELGGAVEVWRMVVGDNPRLERTNERVRLPAGVHTIVAR